MEQQQLKFNQLRAWHPTAIFNRRYHNYAVVVMSQPLKWKTRQLFPVWEKAKLTVTVDSGTYMWINYLEDAGIDVFSGQYNEFVPKVIITEVINIPGAPPSVVEKLESLGSKVIYAPRQNRGDFIRALNSIADYVYDMNINLYEMYLFSEATSNFDNLQIAETLRLSDGNVRNIEIIIVTRGSFSWMLRHGWHRIHVTPDTCRTERVAPDILDEEEPTAPLCSFFVFDNCEVNSLTTTGLETDFVSASVRELDQGGALIPWSEDVVTVDTDASIIWVMNLDITKEEIYDESSDDEFVDR